jgi:hypothetical protein
MKLYQWWALKLEDDPNYLAGYNDSYQKDKYRFVFYSGHDTATLNRFIRDL